MTMTTLYTLARTFLGRLLRPAELTPEEAEALARGFRMPGGRPGVDAMLSRGAR